MIGWLSKSGILASLTLVVVPSTYGALPLYISYSLFVAQPARIIPNNITNSVFMLS